MSCKRYIYIYYHYCYTYYTILWLWKSGWQKSGIRAQHTLLDNSHDEYLQFGLNLIGCFCFNFVSFPFYFCFFGSDRCYRPMSEMSTSQPTFIKCLCVVNIYLFFFYFELTDNFEVPMHRTKDLTWKYVVQYRTPFATTRFINTLSLSQYWRLRRSNQSQPIQIITRNVLLCWLCDNNSANSKTIHLEYVTLSTVVYTHMR